MNAAVCKLVPEKRGRPNAFELLGNFGEQIYYLSLSYCEHSKAVQIDGQYGSYDRQRIAGDGVWL